jgi:thioredoxin-like negative regulator of GroEL
MDQFLRELQSAGESLVVVDFYARWCGACRALYPKLCKLAVLNPEVVFLKVEFDDNKDLCRSMGVKVLPFFHMYKGKAGKVAGFSASVTKVNRLRDALEEHGGVGQETGGREVEQRETAGSPVGGR